MDPVMRKTAFAMDRASALASAGSGPQLLAIEGELTGPGAREALERYDAVLAGLDERLADALREGVSPDDFPKLQQLRDANVVARKILRLALRDGETNKI